VVQRGNLGFGHEIWLRQGMGNFDK
jgi:hypothetical protein